ncbi:MAG: hypothetical protein HZA89_08925 [Verrucomicrobia bacterium]|nr:hypothetical protein [Verrucomicrobiota bacterium]
MNPLHWPPLQRLAGVFVAPAVPPELQLQRLRFMERNIMLPIKVLVLTTLAYYFFFTNWLADYSGAEAVRIQILRTVFLIYLAVNIVAAVVFQFLERLPLAFSRWFAMGVSLGDGLFVAALTLMTGGWGSVVYWVFIVLIVRNSVSIPVAAPQIVLNLLVTGFYALAGLEFRASDITEPSSPELARVAVDTQLVMMRVFLLLLVTACCYGVQVLVDRQRQAEEEARESSTRQDQLQASGRLAAEIAHQLKNPLAIINNAAFNLQRALLEKRGDPAPQIEIIREEVNRADRIITELMGYAKLAEGRVEKLDAAGEMDHALAQVLPEGAQFEIRVTRRYAPHLPPLWMQRGHLQDILVNVLQNAREAMEGRGELEVQIQATADPSVQISVRDTGPGIPPELHGKIFEPYFTTRKKGTGLGLAIAKHNAELYGGTVRVESELGRGARFVLDFPAKARSTARA